MSKTKQESLDDDALVLVERDKESNGVNLVNDADQESGSQETKSESPENSNEPHARVVNQLPPLIQPLIVVSPVSFQTSYGELMGVIQFLSIYLKNMKQHIMSQANVSVCFSFSIFFFFLVCCLFKSFRANVSKILLNFQFYCKKSVLLRKTWLNR